MADLIFHIDINSYFATMLQQENPSLRGKPVGVTKGEGRSCIIASSNEAKQYGIKTGCSVREAKQRFPGVILVPAHFDMFLSSTHRLKSVFTSVCPHVEIFSLDEAFLNFTGCEILMAALVGTPTPAPLPLQCAQYIQQRIKEVLGEWVQCNIGIADNKLLAKMASEVAPKGGVSLVTPETLDTMLATVRFRDVCGVGYRLEKRLAALGVTTPYEINLLDDETLQDHFGPFWAAELRKIGQGEETHFFTHTRKVEHMQSVGRTFTGYGMCDDEERIKQTLLNLLEEATSKMRHMQLSGRSVGITLWGNNTYWGHFQRLKRYVRHTDEVFDIIYHTWYKQWKRTFPVIKFGVFIGHLHPTVDLPLSWLPEDHKRDTISRARDAINDRFGLFTLRPATLLQSPLIRPEVTGFLGDKTYHGL